ncbi:MAG: PEP-CTERM sorting domain-containing protein [Cyanobacteria bacterium J06592_8]
MKRVEYLGAVISTIGLVAGVTASPATAITFSQGDRFTGTTNFNINGNAATSLDLDFLDVNGNSGGGTGNFGIANATAVGAFSDYTTNSAIVGENTIRDTNFGVAGSVVDFLSYDDGAGGLDEWSIDLTNISIENDFISGNMRFVDIGGLAIFKGDNQVQGSGGFQALLTIDQTTNQAQFDFEAEAVPEPLTLLSTGVAAGFAGLFKRQSDKRKQNQA